MNRMMLLPFALLAIGCADESQTQRTAERSVAVETPLNVETAQLQADVFLKTLLPDTVVNGPVCMPEAVVDQMTQCSYSFRSGPDWKIGTLLCGNDGCREGEAPAVVPPDVLPQTVYASGSSGMSNEMLAWWILFNSGATHHHYSVWYDSTPPIYRSVYYAPGYRPSVDSVHYYRTTYSPTIVSSGKKYVRPVTTTRTTTTTRPTTYKTTPSSSYKGTSTTPSSSYKSTTPAPAPKPALKSTRSSGYGTPTRSTGSSRPSSSSRSSSSSRGRR